MPMTNHLCDNKENYESSFTSGTSDQSCRSESDHNLQLLNGGKINNEDFQWTQPELKFDSHSYSKNTDIIDSNILEYQEKCKQLNELVQELTQLVQAAVALVVVIGMSYKQIREEFF